MGTEQKDQLQNGPHTSFCSSFSQLPNLVAPLDPKTYSSDAACSQDFQTHLVARCFKSSGVFPTSHFTECVLVKTSKGQGVTTASHPLPTPPDGLAFHLAFESLESLDSFSLSATASAGNFGGSRSYTKFHARELGSQEFGGFSQQRPP